MTQTTEVVMRSYITAYEQLYNRRPADLRVVDQDWVIVNGARMRKTELAMLTQQLQKEYQQSMSEKRNMVARLIKWFKG